MVSVFMGGISNYWIFVNSYRVAGWGLIFLIVNFSSEQCPLWFQLAFSSMKEMVLGTCYLPQLLMKFLTSSLSCPL